MHQEGMVLRAAGLPSLTGDLGGNALEATPSLDLEEASLLADRNMAALLEEETHDAAKEGKKKKKKKRSKKAFDPDAPAEEGDEDGEAQPTSHEAAPSTNGNAPPPPPPPAPASPKPPAASAAASVEASEDVPEEPTEQVEARRALDEVAATAAELCRVEGDAPPASLESMQRTLKALDGAIDRACALTVRWVVD